MSACHLQPEVRRRFERPAHYWGCGRVTPLELGHPGVIPFIALRDTTLLVNGNCARNVSALQIIPPEISNRRAVE